jgi:3-isopropylmalate/(R)-2-methylmalate dehydratase large subunit
MGSKVKIVDEICSNRVVPADGFGIGCPELLFVDLDLLDILTSPQAFNQISERGLGPRKMLATTDRVASTDHPIRDYPASAERSRTNGMLAKLETNCAEFRVPLLHLESGDRGAAHVVGPELNLMYPSMTVVYSYSHTCYSSAPGAQQLGLGIKDAAMVLATQCIRQILPRVCTVRIEGTLRPRFSAGEIAQRRLARSGQEAGKALEVQLAEQTNTRVSIDDSITSRNTSVECCARSRIVSPDETTFAYWRGQRSLIQAAALPCAVNDCGALPGNAAAIYYHIIEISVDALAPTLSCGTTQSDAIPIPGLLRIPRPFRTSDPTDDLRREQENMRFRPEADDRKQRVISVSIGSFKNSRLSDLRTAEAHSRDHSAAESLRHPIAHRSRSVPSAAEPGGVNRVFLETNTKWHGPRNSMRLTINIDRAVPGATIENTGRRYNKTFQATITRTIPDITGTANTRAVPEHFPDARTSL